LDVARVADRPLGLGIDVAVRGGVPPVLAGPDGSGGTTPARALGGLLPPVSGELSATPALAGSAVERPSRSPARDLLTRLGTVFQAQEHQFLAATVREELAVGPRALRRPVAEIADRVDELLDRLGLAPLAAAHPFTLSGGQKRRLSV